MQAFIRNKKRKLLREKLSENTGQSKSFGKLPGKKAPPTSICFNKKKELPDLPG